MGPESLLVRARAGDRQAWDDLLAWSRPVICAVLGRRLNSPEDASELTNDVQMRMHKGFSCFRGVTRGQFLAWALIIARRVRSDHLGKVRPPLVELIVDLPCPQVDVGATVNHAEEPPWNSSSAPACRPTRPAALVWPSSSRRCEPR
jgi:DNA-directed RNA polymerase specialized sigma24 family protein